MPPDPRGGLAITKKEQLHSEQNDRPSGLHPQRMARQAILPSGRQLRLDAGLHKEGQAGDKVRRRGEFEQGYGKETTIA